jgi:hypothetical protein
LESVKQLFQVFTDKELFLEWLLAINLDIGQKILNAQTGMKVDRFAEVNEEIDLRTAPKAIKDNKIYNQEVLDMRWNLCSSCEFLTDGKKCQKCGCFMTVKHKLSQARCPIGKWGKYKEEAIHGIATTG